MLGYPIDWAATGSMLQGIGTIAGVGAVIWGAVRATEVWRAQKRTERRLEMAERILSATYKAREGLSYVRGRMHWAAELSKAEDRLKGLDGWGQLTKDRQKNLTTAQVVYDRLVNVKEERASLNDCLPLARALFNEELERALEQLRRQFWLIQVDAESYGDGIAGLDENFVKKLRRAIFDIAPRNGEKNEISDAIAESVAIIERICEPALRLEKPD